jgi:thymidylate synthase (FAD)
MKVKLISYTQPTEEFRELTGAKDVQDLIVYCARVSNPSNQSNFETSEKLLNYLLKHKHFSPFEMCNAVLEIETTRDIARQLLRHRSCAFQEYSQRYADPTKDLEFVTRQARFQDDKNRQNSIDIDLNIPAHRELSRLWEEKQQEINRIVRDSYSWAVSNGIAKEQARAILPEGNTVSRLYANNTIRGWLHYCEVRTDPSTQKEHRELAQAIAIEIAKVISFFKKFE